MWLSPSGSLKIHVSWGAVWPRVHCGLPAWAGLSEQPEALVLLFV